MKFYFLLSLSFLLFAGSVFGQGYGVKGSINDSVEHVKLINASVAILNAKDSTLVTFTRAAQDGSFDIKNLHKGKFILLLAYPDYADYVQHFSLDSVKQLHNFGHINMELKSRLLHEVIIKGATTAIKIKGDTTEFNAAAYKIQPNAKVEDLLKQLPGIQVDQDGKITAQGQTVNKVLVDGEEFFGDDPTLVTKNLRADMVDKVQLYDKKSDQATFTGIDDGKKEKTINIKLKADKKNGVFGKAEAGDGNRGMYEGQLLFNAFTARQKFSVYGTIGNDGKMGLGWQDNQKYASGNNVDVGDDGTIYITGGSGDDLDSFGGQYNGQGLPTARTGGVHYDGKWNGDKESINTNYKIGSLAVDGNNDNITQNNLPGTILFSTSDQAFHKYMFRQKLDATYQIKLDTTSNLKLVIDGTKRHSQAIDSYTARVMRNDSLVNNSFRNLNNNVDADILNASAFYTKKFKKKGRTLSFLISEAYNDSQAKGNLRSTINYYNYQGRPDSSQVIDEYKTNDLKSSVLNTNLTYTEPLGKSLAVVLNYGINVNNGTADRKTFSPSAPGDYNILVDSLSSDFRLNQLTNQGGAILNYKKGRSIVNFGTKVSTDRFREIDEYTQNALVRTFVNWNPQASWQYRFSQQRSFNIDYTGRTQQPSLDQIQPVRVNNDPLNIILGNPDLKPSFQNRFSANYNSYKIVSGQYIWLYGEYVFTSNPIVNDVTTDYRTGKSRSEYFNLPGKETSRSNLGANFSRKIEKLDFNVGLGMGANGSIYYNMVNGALNQTTNYTFNPRINFSKYEQKKLELYFYGGPTYTLSKSSLQPNLNNNGSGFNANGGFTIYLPAKFRIGTNSSYQYSAPTQSFNTSFSKTLINAFIIKTFLKDDNLRFTLWGNDLLNQNIGFSRFANSNLITQNSYTTLRRYFMFSIDYDFTRMGGGSSKK
jgi:hypothetical protein